jgi:hypothetical protein
MAKFIFVFICMQSLYFIYQKTYAIESTYCDSIKFSISPLKTQIAAIPFSEQRLLALRNYHQANFLPDIHFYCRPRSTIFYGSRLPSSFFPSNYCTPSELSIQFPVGILLASRTTVRLHCRQQAPAA